MAATAQEEADGGQARTEQTVGRRRRRADGARSGRDGRPTTGGATADGRERTDGDVLLLLKKVRPRIRDGRTAEARRRLLLLLQLDD